jgi:hypothetical protein
MLAPFSVSTERAERYITDYILHQELGRTLLRTMGARHVEITYEQLMGNKKETLAQIAAFIEVDDFHDYSHLQKLVGQPYREIVTNYDELVEIENAVKQRIQG